LGFGDGRGGNPPTYLSTVDQTNNGETFRNLPDLEIENRDSCVVAIDDDRIFTCGGDQGLTDTFIFSNTTNLWSSMTDMPSPRNEHSCGLVLHPENGAEIVVAGGFSTPSETNESVDIYTVSTDSWRSAQSLPEPITRASVVPFNNTFLVVGGFGNGEYSGNIYQYIVADDDWFKMDTELKTPRSRHVALLVQQSLFPDCA